MRFRFPQPLQGWRVFFGEVGIIVLGVLIALGASQLVETWQWQQQVKQADELFRDEMDAATSNAYLQLAIEPCLETQLEVLAAKLNQPAGIWRGVSEELNWAAAGFPVPTETTPVPYRGSSAFALMTTEGWSNAVASGTVNHMPFVRGTMLARAYTAAAQLSADQRQEREAIAKLLPLATDRDLDARLRLEMLQNVSEIRRILRQINADSGQVLLAAKQAGLGYTDAGLHQVVDGNNAFLLDLERKLRGSCVRKPDIP